MLARMVVRAEGRGPAEAGRTVIGKLIGSLSTAEDER